MSMERSVGIDKDRRPSIKYCAECGAKVPKEQKTCPSCGESL